MSQQLVCSFHARQAAWQGEGDAVIDLAGSSEDEGSPRTEAAAQPPAQRRVIRLPGLPGAPASLLARQAPPVTLWANILRGLKALMHLLATVRPESASQMCPCSWEEALAGPFKTSASCALCRRQRSPRGTPPRRSSSSSSSIRHGTAPILARTRRLPCTRPQRSMTTVLRQSSSPLWA